MPGLPTSALKPQLVGDQSLPVKPFRATICKTGNDVLAFNSEIKKFAASDRRMTAVAQHSFIPVAVSAPSKHGSMLDQDFVSNKGQE